MARINPIYLDSVFYLYSDEGKAHRGEPEGGNGFIVKMPFKEHMGEHGKDFPGQFYAVTNSHLLDECRRNARNKNRPRSILRMNTTDGKTEIISKGVEEWTVAADDDLAAIPLDLPERFAITFLGPEFFLTKEKIEKHALGAGNDVFIVGRFVYHEGRERNLATVRFGNVSMMPEEPVITDRGLQEAFLVEFRSVGGYSGSPVFICEPPFHLPQRGHLIQSHSLGPQLLGVDCGHLRDFGRVLQADRKTPVKPTLYAASSTAMAVVIPSWRILDLLDSEDFVTQREKAWRDRERARKISRVQFDSAISERGRLRKKGRRRKSRKR